MPIYIAIIEDRHIGVQAEAFTTAEKAIAYVKEFVEAKARDPEDIKEGDVEEGCLYFAYVRVVEGELDPEWEDE